MNIKFKKVLALLLVLTMLFSVTSASTVFAADGDTTQAEEVTDPPVTEEPEDEDINDKGDVLTTQDGKFEYYKYELTDKETGVTNYIIEIKSYLGSDKEVVITEKLDEAASSPYTVQIIGNDAFMENRELLKVTLPSTITKLGNRAFNNCTELYSINLPDSIKVIDSYALAGCSSINAIHMPESIERIGTGAFFGCTRLVGNASIPSEIPNEDGSYPMVMALIFPSTLTYIGDNAFAMCESLVNVIIPSSVTAIYTATFTNCISLEKVDIPYEVTYVGAAFNGAFTGHANTSTYEPTLIIRNPHCVIALSDEMDKHMVVKGVRYSLVNHMAEEGGYVFEAIDPPAQHNYSYSGVVTPPTCYDEGYTTYTCDCGLYDDFCITDFVPSPGHQYGDWYLGGTGEGDESSLVDPKDVFVMGGDDDGGILGGLVGEDGSVDLDSILGGETTTPDTDEEKITIVSNKPISEEEFKAIQMAGAYKPFCTAGEGISRKCTVCGDIQTGNKNPVGHMIYNVTTATCTEYGVVKEKCAACSVAFSHKAAAPLGHVWAEEKELISEYEKCKTDGILRCTCITCGEKFDEITPAHADANKDQICDDCSAELEKTTCSCNCHKTGFFWELINKICVLLWKLFKIAPRCACGIAHY